MDTQLCGLLCAQVVVFQCVAENVTKGISAEVLHCVCFSLSEESSKPDSDVRIMFS